MTNKPTQVLDIVKSQRLIISWLCFAVIILTVVAAFFACLTVTLSQEKKTILIENKKTQN